MVLLVVRLVVLLVGRLVVVGFVADGDPLSAALLGAGEVAMQVDDDNEHGDDDDDGEEGEDDHHRGRDRWRSKKTLVGRRSN